MAMASLTHTSLIGRRRRRHDYEIRRTCPGELRRNRCTAPLPE
jgi:hypothetical protein